MGLSGLGVGLVDLALVLRSRGRGLTIFFLLQQIAELGLLGHLTGLEILERLRRLDPTLLGLLGQCGGLVPVVFEGILQIVEIGEKDLVVVGCGSRRVDRNSGQVVALETLVERDWICEQGPERTAASAGDLGNRDPGELHFELVELGLLFGDFLFGDNDLSVELRLFVQRNDDVLVVLVDLLVHPVDFSQYLLHCSFLIADTARIDGGERDDASAQPDDHGEGIAE